MRLLQICLIVLVRWFYNMCFEDGVVYYFRPCRTSVPTKDKYALCVCAKQGWFYLINSCTADRPWEHEKGHVLYLQPFQTEPLKHKSYINTKKLVYIGPNDYDTCRKYVKVSQMVWLDLKKLCYRTLPPYKAKKIFG